MIRKRIGKPPSDVVVCFYSRGGQNREKKGEALLFTIAELLREGRIGPLKTTYPVHGSTRVNLNFEVLERYALLDAAFFYTK